MGERTAAEIAAGLTKEQRDAVLDARCSTDPTDDDRAYYVHQGAARGLMSLGITKRWICGAYLSDLGLAVRAELKERGDG